MAKQNRHGNKQDKPKTAYTVFDVPAGRVRLEDLTDKDWAAQLSALERAYGHISLKDPTRRLSEETRRNRRDILFSTVRLIMKDRRLKTISQVRPRYIERIIQLWDEEKISKRAQHNYYAVLRWFWWVCGIRVPPLSSFERTAGEFSYNSAAETDKSWSGNGVDFDQKLKEIEAFDPIAARLILAMRTFGLRAKESLRLQPHEADGGDRLKITKGSKTGRPREIILGDFDQETLRQVLDELKGQVAEGVHLAWSKRTLAQAKRRLYYVCELFGLTKRVLGVTMHGLRHQWAIEQLQTLGNITAPVRGGKNINYRALSDVRRKITQAMGHNRTRVTSAYYGSFLTMRREHERRFQKSWSLLEPCLASIHALLLSAGVENLYLVGSRATGSNKSPDDFFELLLGEGTDLKIAILLKPKIADIVIHATGIDCRVYQFDELPDTAKDAMKNDAIPLFVAISPETPRAADAPDAE